MFRPFAQSIFDNNPIKIEPLNYYSSSDDSFNENQPQYLGDKFQPQLLSNTEFNHTKSTIKSESESQITVMHQMNEVNARNIEDGSTVVNNFNLPGPDIASKDTEVKNEGRQVQQCKVCGKFLSSSSSYYVHLKQHSDSKPYHCGVCEASFCRKPYLEVHMRVHTGEKPYECETCKKRFTQKSSLNTHKRGHTGLRPYACTICLKRFSVKSYLTAHQWTHVSEQGIACNECEMSFTNKTQYLQHMRVHNNKGYECIDCKRAFAKESYLIRHVNRVHKGGADDD